MEKMMSNMMVLKSNGGDNFSFWPVDDQVMNSTLWPETEDQTTKVVKKHRKRKPQNTVAEHDVVSMKRKLKEDQAARLELYFAIEPRLETERKDRIAAELELEPRQVAVWFQNRRARWKCKKLEDEFANLKTSHYSALAQKAQLEALVSELNGRLMEAEGEIRRLLARFEGSSQRQDNMATTTTPPSSVTMDQAGMFPMEVMQQLETDYVQMMDYHWMNNNNMYDIVYQ